MTMQLTLSMHRAQCSERNVISWQVQGYERFAVKNTIYRSSENADLVKKLSKILDFAIPIRGLIATVSPNFRVI